MTVQLAWHVVAAADATSLVVRQGTFPASSLLHSHDFAEVFVVESGHASHVIGGTAQALSSGDMVFVSPTDCHQFVEPSSEFTITNVAFPPMFMEGVREMAPTARDAWNNDTKPMPIGRVDQTRLLRRAHELARTGTPVRLLLFLAEALLAADRSDQIQSQPEWLRRSLAEWHEDSDAMRDGVAGLARLAGRSREHVSRVIKSSTGRRAVDLVNEGRIELAASLLQTSDDNIATIAYHAGFESLSHFYHLFRSRHGTTPRQYRLQKLRVIGAEDR